MRTLLTIAAAGALLSTGALAQTAAPQPSPATAAENGKTAQANISTPAVPRSTTANASASSLDIRKSAPTAKGRLYRRSGEAGFVGRGQGSRGPSCDHGHQPGLVTEVIAEGASNPGMNSSGANS